MSIWKNDTIYIAVLEMEQNFIVINGTVERDVKLISEHYNFLIKNKENKQYILQKLEKYR